MDSLKTIGLKQIALLPKQLVTDEKYAIIFDKNGNCGTFFNYAGSVYEFNKEMLKVQMDKITKEQAIEEFRKQLVNCALFGKTLVVSVDILRPDFVTEWVGDAETLPATLFNFKEWRKEENHMQIVRKDENRSMMGDANNYCMATDGFTIIFLAAYKSDQDITDFCNRIPCSDQMDKIIV